MELEHVKPQWAIRVRVAAQAVADAEYALTAAYHDRCQGEDSRGAQCTLDNGHEGRHRVRREDRP